LIHWLAALSSIVLLLVLLVGLGWKSTEAGPLGLFLAAVVAVLLFRTPFTVAASSRWCSGIRSFPISSPGPLRLSRCIQSRCRTGAHRAAGGGLRPDV